MLNDDFGGPPGTTFRALESDDLVTRIADQVVRAIGDGRLRPGAKVAEAKLARELGTSRAPAREALRLLESQGLIVSHPRRGFFVHAYDADELADIYDLRECLELHAAEGAMARITDEDIARLTDQVALLHTLGAAGAAQEQVVEDYGFHRMLCEIGGNRRIVKLFDHIATELRAGIALVGRVYDDPVTLAATHEPLMEAIRARDAERLKRELREHLVDARTHVVRLFRDTAADPKA